MAESVIRRFEICYDTLWKVLRRLLIEELGIAEIPKQPQAHIFALLTRTAYWRRVLNSGSSTYELA